jgi:hypothetical protein
MFFQRELLKGATKGVYGGDTVFFREDGVACDEGIGAVADDEGCGFVVDAAVDFDPYIGADDFTDGDDFFCGVVDEFLPAKAGVDRHNQNHITKMGEFFDCSDGRFGIQAQAGGNA